MERGGRGEYVFVHVRIAELYTDVKCADDRCVCTVPYMEVPVEKECVHVDMTFKNCPCN